MTIFSDKATEQETIAFTNTQSKEADFQALRTGFYLKTDANVYIAFDRPANTGDFLLASTDGIAYFEKIKATRVSALGASGTGNLYIIGVV